ncbi:MAG TPA: hypothetical protein VEC14_15415 [Reyranellaceae bacterium]|nr:hypothetical protein [Reyranellaceae bacterium]
MRVSTVIILAIIVMAAATFAHPRDCRHACKMDANGVVVATAKVH